MLIPSLKRNTNAAVPWQWHACYMFACEYNRNAPPDLMADNELSQPLIFTQCGGFWVCVCVCVGGGGRGEACVIGETLLCFAVEQSKQCLKRKASSGKRKQKERLQASLMLTT